MIAVDAYTAEIAQWRQTMDDRLRAEDGWLTLVGLDWLHEGTNTIGSDPTADVHLPSGAAYLGTLELVNGQVTLRVTAAVPVTVDQLPVTTAVLRHDLDEGGASQVRIGSVSFFIIQRGNEYGVRVRDTTNPARLSFAGRQWFPIDLNYRVSGTFVPHANPRTLQIVTSGGQITPMQNPGRVEFTLNGQALALEAFATSKNEYWLVFKDSTSGQSTYGAGRFLYTTTADDGSIIVDFNRAYHPPCAFSPYTTCPRPPQENILDVTIMAGEHL